MIRIIDGRGTGKTSRLMLVAKDNNAAFVCENPYAMEAKARAYGIVGIDFVSYYDFFKDKVKERPYVVDEMENLTRYIGGGKLVGYSLSAED